MTVDARRWTPMEMHLENGKYRRCPICQGIVDRDHDQALAVEEALLLMDLDRALDGAVLPDNVFDYDLVAVG